MKRGIISVLGTCIALGAITVSCEKEQFNPAKEHKTTCVQTKDGGDDDDDPVIRGKVKKSNGAAVDSALVETLTYGTAVKVGTTYSRESGDYAQRVKIGIYYLKVTNPKSGLSVYTDTIHVDSDREINVTAN